MTITKQLYEHGRAPALPCACAKLGLWLGFAAACCLPARVVTGDGDAETPWPLLPLTADDVDFESCLALVDGQPVSGDAKAGILATLGLRGGEPWSAGRGGQKSRYDYVLAFKRPVGVGSVLCEHNGGTLRFLEKDAPFPPDVSRAELWHEVSLPFTQSGWRLGTLPPATSTRAFLFSVEKGWWEKWSSFSLLRLFSPRLHNIVPDGLANGEAEYISYADLRPPIFYVASNITRGWGTWQSHGPDQERRIRRPPVTDIDPTWFVLSWDEPPTVCGLLLRSNFRKFHLFSYRGPDGVNPAVAPDRDWKAMKYSARGDGRARWLTFAPVTTRGFKFLGVDAEGPYGMVEGLHAYVDLKGAAVPPGRPAGSDPEFKIRLTLPGDGLFSMAIDGPDGRRVRNAVSREDRKGGPCEQSWDLKDEAGRFVQPATYRWKAVWHPGLRLRYEMTPYPNVEMNAPENAPWLQGAAGPGGWLADHSTPSAGCAAGDRVFFSAPCAESGVALIECDLRGRKLWGHHNLMPWVGPSILASDGQALYAAPWTSASGTDIVWRFTLPEKRLDTLLHAGPTPTRFRGIRGLAARGGKLFLSIQAGQPSIFEDAATASDADLDHCEPRYGAPRPSHRPDNPDPRSDFLRLFRLAGTPPGCHGLTELETVRENAPRQHIVLAFQKPVSIGSLVFPLPETEGLFMHISVLKPQARLPPASSRESDWQRIWKGGGKGWTVVPAPEKTQTRAIRLSFDHGLDELEEVSAEEKEEKEGEGGLDVPAKESLEFATSQEAWKARLEGMRILRGRFANLFPSCRVRVDSGTLTPEGEWDAQRDKPLTTADPGIYLMEWDAPQSIAGLAIKEIDGRTTEIDAWVGAGDPVLKGDAGWEKVSTYEQPLRYYYQPDANHNSSARYLDGMVDFGREVRTRALRLRVVQQWLWKEEDRAGCVGVRRDRGGETLDPARCRVYGVAALQHLGGGAAADPLTTDRLEVYDIESRKIVQEIPMDRPGNLAFSPDGVLWAASSGKIVRVDLDAGSPTPLAIDVRQPGDFAFDSSGNLFLFDGAPDQRLIKVYHPSGTLIRNIGTPGGRAVGAHDPTRFGSVCDVTLDAQNQLWVVENDWFPKRITLWTAEGKLRAEFFGNTGYGGGGCLNPYDKSSLFYGPLEFALDWNTGDTRLKNITWMGNSPAGEVPIRLRDRLYFVTRPLFLSQAVGVVYLYQKDRLQRVAAVGRAGNFEPLRTSSILEKLGRTPLGNAAFAWSDRNGDENPQPGEVEFFESGRRDGAVSRFEDSLSIDSGAYRYEVKEILVSGVPIYERIKKSFSDGAMKLSNGRFFVIGNEHQMAELDAGGNPIWTHPTEGWGVHALYSARPWFSGQTVAQFGIVGHETAAAGDLGEFLVTHGNSGVWHIWTADGLLAGRIFRDMRGPGARPWSMAEHARGMDLSDVTAGQEHFNGYFCRTREDNRYYVVAGHNHASVVEVEGLDQFRRLGDELKVSAQDVQSAIEWDRKKQARKIYETAKLIECRPVRNSITLDGSGSEWDFESARLAGRDVSLALAYDNDALYLCFEVSGCGPLRNAGNDWRRLFKTGAAVDLQIGVDPGAPAARTDPAPGDVRLLMTLMGDRPTAVLYQPVYPRAKPEDSWEARTLVFQAKFDRVVLTPEVRLAARGHEHGYTLEAAIPLGVLGLTPRPDLTLKMDWGILVSGPDGTEVLQRLYWSNPQTSIVSDEAAEATLHPELWGTVKFRGRSDKEAAPELDLQKKTETGDASDEVEDVEMEEGE
ncbi:MAG: hypothetical protein HYU36_11350 [Planctomycetes bacterium]|nr:hypothetical protein [Planctomycetota bacterium]